MSDEARMQRFLEEEKRKAVFNEVVAKLADVCFDVCVTQPRNKMSTYEAQCLSRCGLRYLEAGQVILGKMRETGGG